MARSNAYITITCDGCGFETELEATELVDGILVERDIDRDLTSAGWVITGGGEICTVCAEGDE
jgi:hypothetical protein